ncbi:MAG: hypothetical protein H0V89_14150 [Deltaproteobacteria bacterium]|nr:hypothetical protein [Deltaproteobacteria bacterium]
MGIATAPWDEADYRVHVYVLKHAGRRDVSDANWVNTVSGGIAGTVGKFVVPQFSAVDARLRLEVRRRDGSLAALRDVASLRVERRALAITWQYWSLFQRSLTAEMFARALAEVHEELVRDAMAVIDQARHERPVVTGVVPDLPVYASLGSFERPDTFRIGRSTDDVGRAKYGSDRFSVVSGWHARKGEIIGRIGVPDNNVGYDVGLGEGSQLLLDLTVLGRVNSVAGGGRYRFFRSGRWAMAVEGRVAAEWNLLEEAAKGQWIGKFDPAYTGTTGTGVAVVSWHEGIATPYTRLIGRVGVLTDGTTTPAVGAAPGLEVNLGPTLALAAEFGFFLEDEELVLAPQVTVGLR